MTPTSRRLLAISACLALAALLAPRLLKTSVPSDCSTCEPSSLVTAKFSTSTPAAQTPPDAPSPVSREIAQPAPAAPVIVAREDGDNHTSVLFRQAGEFPWIRLEAEYEFDEIGQHERVVSHETFAGDRVRVYAKPGVTADQIKTWARALGAEARPLASVDAGYDFVWPDVKMDTLTTSMKAVLGDLSLAQAAEPVQVPFTAYFIDVKKNLNPAHTAKPGV